MALSPVETQNYLKELTKRWKVRGNKGLRLQLEYNNFTDVIDMVNTIADLAEKLDHHPDMKIYKFNQLQIDIVSHDTGSLTQRDFILAKELEKIV